MILALETATNICSISFQNQEGEIYEKRTERKGSHSELLFLFIRELMKEHNFKMSDLDTVLVSSGPGSYTGLRIAVSAVKGMLFGLNTDVFSMNTLAGFARSAGQGRIHAVINARRKHLYYQRFEFKDDTLTAATKSELLELSEIQELLTPGDKLIGTGIERLGEKFLKEVEVLTYSHISSRYMISLFNDSGNKMFFAKTRPEELESNYLSSSQVNNTKV